ncbi:hypothetical protein ACJX0J_032878 [Zea mays]
MKKCLTMLHTPLTTNLFLGLNQLDYTLNVFCLTMLHTPLTTNLFLGLNQLDYTLNVFLSANAFEVVESGSYFLAASILIWHLHVIAKVSSVPLIQQEGIAPEGKEDILDMTIEEFYLMHKVVTSCKLLFIVKLHDGHVFFMQINHVISHKKKIVGNKKYEFNYIEKLMIRCYLFFVAPIYYKTLIDDCITSE